MILFKTKNIKEHIDISNKLHSILYKFDCETCYKYTCAKTILTPKNWILQEEKIKNSHTRFHININNRNYYFSRLGSNETIEQNNTLLIDIEGNVWHRSQYYLNPYDSYKEGLKERLCDQNTLCKPDEFLFRLPEGLAQYPINDSLNVSGQWDLISNVNQWKKEMKEMSSKW